MLLRTSIGYRNAGKKLKAFSVTLLLLSYIAGNTQLETFHQLFHADKTVVHSAEQEHDPCHQTLYHNKKDDGCKHSSHVVAFKKCPFCESISANEHILVAHYTHTTSGLSTTTSHSPKQLFRPADISSSLLPRAPPAS